MKNIAARYAVIVFIFTVAWTLMEHLLGYNTTNHAVGSVTRLVTAYVYYGTVAFAIWKVRRVQGNVLSYRDGMLTGFYCSLTYSMLVTLWFALYGEVINKQFQPTLLAYTRTELEAQGKNAETIAENLKMERLHSGGSLVSYLLLFVFLLVFGVLISLIATFIMRRKERPEYMA